MNEPLSKQTLRDEAIKHRARISPFDDGEDPDEACDIFFKALKPSKKDIVAIYWPIDSEFSTASLLAHLRENENPVALPKMKKGSRILEFHTFEKEEDLKAGRYNVMEPAGGGAKPVLPDIVIVPLLAFDRKGYRLGFGGGFYDATLAFLRNKKPDVIAVGWAYAKQAVLFNLPVEEHDQKLDWVITPQKAHYYGT